MIKIIAGEKGTGKTARLVDDINQVASTDSNVVCIERGNRLDQLLKYSVRLINIKEYPVVGYDQLLAFIGGICSKDYDLTHIYIDAIKKVSSCDDLGELAIFLTKLEAFLADGPITVTINLTAPIELLSDDIKKYL
ncbi:hypothetical protein SAMN02910456_02142 [Ruminococcaceae bacterium YRB3002]|nr:hypothetical protein SAMN02910456_02142 [Ruminococcaceae bacterium YRB3002]